MKPNRELGPVTKLVHSVEIVEIEDSREDVAFIEKEIPSRSNSAKLYKGKRTEILQHCLENNGKKKLTLAKYKTLGLKRRTLNQWIIDHKRGAFKGDEVKKRWSTRALTPEQDKKLKEAITEMISRGISMLLNMTDCRL